MRAYKCLNQQVFASGEYQLVPIRNEDRYAIMQWRNEQIYHLRQAEPLTKEKQDWYFNNVVAQLFEQEQPDQILFSFLKGEECIGYGGLVYINWVDSNAEVSFVMKTDLQKSDFKGTWHLFLYLLKQVAFRHIQLRKIYTYAFDIRPELYPALKEAGFTKEARLKDHCLVNDKFHDVLIHSFWNPKLSFTMREANEDDMELFFEWANDPDVRANSFSPDPIDKKRHINWFLEKMNTDKTIICVFESADQPFGQVRFDFKNHYWEIDYSIDRNYRGLGLGKEIINRSLKNRPGKNIKAVVRQKNYASRKVFTALGFDVKELLPENYGELLFEYTYSK